MKYIVFLIMVLMLFSFTDKGKHWYNTIYYYSRYQTSDCKFNGKYRSYYRSGKKKSEGYFKNNYRSGNWKVWDEKGNLIIARNYSSPFEFTVVESKGKNPTSDYKLKRDSDGLYKHFRFTADSVLAAGRIWRLIEPTFNRVLFDNNDLYNLLQNAVISHSVKAYANDSCYGEQDFITTDTSQLNIIAFKTMEDWIIDKERLVLEYYPIAVCPVAVNKSNDTIDLYWIIVDDIRKNLFANKLHINIKNIEVNNLDDHFFLHNYHGKIVRQLAFEDYTHPLNKFDPVSDALRIDLNIIENEHDIWLAYFNR
jgi:hypothetical protein